MNEIYYGGQIEPTASISPGSHPLNPISWVAGGFVEEKPVDNGRLKSLIIESLNLEGVTPNMIEDDTPLFGEGLGLDSVDALELVVALEKEFQIRIEGDDATREAFASVTCLADFIEKTRNPVSTEK